MKKIIALTLIFFFPWVISAKSFSDLRVIPVSNPEISCAFKEVPIGYQLGGCYWPKQNLIFLNSTLSEDWFAFVFFHEFGHWLTEDEDLSLFDGDWEKAADSFAYWMLGKEKNKKVENYFIELVLKLN